MVEELAVRVVGVEELHLQRRRAGAPVLQVARNNLVEPGDHREGRRFDALGRDARGPGRDAGLLEQVKGVALHRVGRAGHAPGSDRRVEFEAEGEQGAEAVEQASHETLASFFGGDGRPGFAPASMTHADVPVLRWNVGFILSTPPRGRHIAWGLCRSWSR
jgi:hypothetical protein